MSDSDWPTPASLQSILPEETGTMTAIVRGDGLLVMVETPSFLVRSDAPVLAGRIAEALGGASVELAFVPPRFLAAASKRGAPREQNLAAIRIVSLCAHAAVRQLGPADARSIGRAIGALVTLEHVCLPPAPVLVSDIVFHDWFASFADTAQLAAVGATIQRLRGASLILVDSAAEFASLYRGVFPILSHEMKRHRQADLIGLRPGEYTAQHHRLKLSYLTGIDVPFDAVEGAIAALARLVDRPVMRLDTAAGFEPYTDAWDLRLPHGASGEAQTRFIAEAIASFLAATPAAPRWADDGRPDVVTRDAAPFEAVLFRASLINLLLARHPGLGFAGPPQSLPYAQARLAREAPASEPEMTSEPAGILACGAEIVPDDGRQVIALMACLQGQTETEWEPDEPGDNDAAIVPMPPSPGDYFLTFTPERRDDDQRLWRIAERTRLALRMFENRRRLPPNASILHLPRDYDLALAFCRRADQRLAAEQSSKYWGWLYARHPQDLEICLALIDSSLRARAFPFAEKAALEGLERIGERAELREQLAAIAERRADWTWAAEHWAAIVTHFPRHPTAGERLAVAQSLAAAAGRAVIANQPLQPPPLVPPRVADQDPAALRGLLLEFESIGSNCEFGLLQRDLGAEPLGLLRLASTSPRTALILLRTRFEGLGEPEHMKVHATTKEYRLRHPRSGWGMHTLIDPAEVPAEKMMRDQARHIGFLRKKLVRELEACSRIFVYQKRDLTDREANEIYDALQEYGPNRLLCVRLQDAHHPPLSLEWRTERLVVAAISRGGWNPDTLRWDIAQDDWLYFCRAAAAAMEPVKQEAQDVLF